MPYRSSGTALCTVCSEFTRGTTCLRCGKPLCAEHVPAVHLRCPDCETEYDQLVLATLSVPLVVLVLRVLLVVGVSMLLVLAGQLRAFHSGGPYLTLAGVIMIAIFLSALVVLCFRRRGLRERFLAEHLGFRSTASR